jgi:hypothetical protein
MAITNFLPKTRQWVDRLYNYIEARPAIYNMVLKMAQRHDNWMDYRKYGTPAISFLLINELSWLCRLDEGRFASFGKSFSSGGSEETARQGII